jgi:hypothetical protein
MILKEFKLGEHQLAEDEWILKIRKDGQYNHVEKKFIENGNTTGFFSKLTQKGQLPVKFSDWGGSYYTMSGHDLPMYVFKEYPRSGWKLIGWRFGMSQNWATVRHPEGFFVEIYLDNFLDVVKESTIDQGVIVGKYKWNNNKLIK